jgi:hypothetical protein
MSCDDYRPPMVSTLLHKVIPYATIGYYSIKKTSEKTDQEIEIF